MSKKISKIFFLLLSNINILDAQCPMCKASVESGMKDPNSKGRGLNDGILYLLATPYIAIAVIGTVWYNKRRK